MCGIAGQIAPSGSGDPSRLERETFAMADALAHRGPDDRGVWVDPDLGLALGHRRLSVLDLSREGAQPMVSSCGRVVLAYNGEIYDFRELRGELESAGRKFRGHSDTEVLVEAIAEWGIETALRRCNGMFALAAWDRSERVLWLARDRLGKKPLYYGWNEGRFVFASELKGLRAHPGFHADVDRDALALFVRHCCIPAPHSIFRGIHKLPPASLLAVRPGGVVSEPREYWSPESFAQAERWNGSDEEAREQLEALLRDATRRRMIADVPMGALLSGGIDSATIVALMQDESVDRVRTFTIGSEDPARDEAPHARAIAEHLGTDHTELTVTARDALDLIPRLPTLFDEPLGDPSQIPTFLVSQMAREHVTVALAGDGGDELFAGYNRYFHTSERWPGIARVPLGLRLPAAAALDLAARGCWAARGAGLASLGGGLERRAERWRARDLPDYYVRRNARCADARDFVLGASPPLTRLTDTQGWPELDEPAERMMLIDLLQNLPEQLLVKVDRASMGVSLEVRSPLLDHRVVEFALGLPLAMKVRDGERKWLLRRVLDGLIPRELTDRPKWGFAITLDPWLRGPLRDWAESLLSEDTLRSQGYLDPVAVRRAWDQHLAGYRDRRFLLWNLLVFQAWLASS